MEPYKVKRLVVKTKHEDGTVTSHRVKKVGPSSFVPDNDPPPQTPHCGECGAQVESDGRLEALVREFLWGDSPESGNKRATAKRVKKFREDCAEVLQVE